jgi:membrane fusion protein (multidrug efflux system)
MESYLRITAPFAGIVIERNVHPGALVGPTGGPGAATPIVRIVESNRLRLVVRVPEAYTAGVTAGTALSFSVAVYPPPRPSLAPCPASRSQWMSAPERWPWSSM